MSIIQNVRQTLEDFAFKQILIVIGHRTEEPFTANSELIDGAYVAGFLLSCCLIETCGHYLTGRSDDGSSKSSFLAFAKYLTNIDVRYKPEILYKALRCGLVHNYTPSTNTSDGKKEFYELVHGKNDLHLKPRASAEVYDDPMRLQRNAATGVSFPDGITAKLADTGTYLNLQTLVFHLQSALGTLFTHADTIPAIKGKIEKCAKDNGFLSVR